MPFAPLDLVSAHPWQRVTFTTYALSLSFFEAVILDGLVRGGASQALILADVDGVRASLSEQGAQRAGKDYEIEPVANSHGVFHPKVSVFSAPTECHVLIGSGNLTFGGWGGNCEVVEHLHARVAADAIADVAEFFELLPDTDRIRQGATHHCAAIAHDLRQAIAGQPRRGDVRVLHSLRESITVQIERLVGELGGATRMLVAAPFWDDGSAIDALCDSVGLDHVFVHVHSRGSVVSQTSCSWPRRTRATVHAVQAEVLEAEGEQRRLHAKVFEILCRRGRVVISGSANATAAALGDGRNIEACVARIQRSRIVGWSFTPTDPPPFVAPVEAVEPAEDTPTGILRAVFDEDTLSGEILTPNPAGQVVVYDMTPLGPERIADTVVGKDGTFRVRATRLEARSWRGGRIIIRVQYRDGRSAEGFVSVASFGDITRRAGLVARRLFAMLEGSEAPADVAAIFGWFQEDPRRLLRDGAPPGGHGESSKTNAADQMIPISALTSEYARTFSKPQERETSGPENWSRFMDQIFSAFRDRRGPFVQRNKGRAADEEEDASEGEDAAGLADADGAEADPAIPKAFANFDRLFTELVKPGRSPHTLLMAFDMTQYVCDRLEPDAAKAKEWLDRLIKALLSAGVPSERTGDAAAAVLARLGASPDSGMYRWARASLLRIGMDLKGEAPPSEPVTAFVAVLPQQVTFPEMWERLRSTRTYAEQIQSYRRALEAQTPSSEYSDLPTAAPEEWPVLARAITTPRVRTNLEFVATVTSACPRCSIALPPRERAKLESTGIATAASCCGRIVIVEGQP